MRQLSNKDVAAVFYEMAELLSIKGTETHRRKAFQRIGKILEGLPEPIPRMLRFGNLDKVPGLGEGTIHRVKQILRTGTCDDLEKLRASTPPGLRELLEIKGLGPSTVRLLHQRLRVTNLDQLEAAVRAGRLLDLPRFGVDTAHAILHEIEVYKARRGQLPLFEALQITREIVEHLRAAGAVEAAPGGSIRRRKALIGDLDVLAAADDFEPVIDAFIHHPNVAAVLTRRADGANVRLHSMQQADLWVFPPESWGAGLHAWSGSKEHVVALRTRAGRMGFHISEHGVFTKDRKKRLTPGRTEEEIFSAVGLPWIPPELRENRGEMEAAEKGRLPDLVTEEDLRGDLHLHTRESDGTASARDMALKAIELGYSYLAITDHSQSLAIANGLDAERLRVQVEQLHQLEQKLGRLYLLPGIEVDILADGSLDLDASALRRLDWVVASVHDRFDMEAGEMTERIIRAMETGLVDCIGHPTGRQLGRREPYPLDLDRLLTAARRLGVAVEVNGNPRRMDLDEVGCRQAREMGVPVVIDTDAHSPAHLARREFALAAARRGWLEKRHVLNTEPVETLRAFRRDRLRRHGIAVPEHLSRPPVLKAAAAATPAPAEAVATEDTAAADPGVDALVTELGAATLSSELRQRLQLFLQQGDDPPLEAALARLSPNPLQGAFNLLMRPPAAS